ncbi:hypothetical protein [Paenibacillus sp. NPDC057967]|uniref:hypothetical protein n=1 Tax=Paenibacillus sp. NPDC057967 TaxID=3346293 RepID=UPI0036DC51D5
MKRVQIVDYYEEPTTGDQERTVETGYLIAPDVAVTSCQDSTLYFLRVEPSVEEPGTYVECGTIADISFLSAKVDVTSIPPAAALAMAIWASGAQPLTTAV